MNYTAIPKSIVTFQTGNSKPVDVYVWATIKCCSDHKTNISHVTEEKLALLTGLDERTIRRVVKRLREAGCLTVQTAIKEDAVRGFIKRNSYQIKPVEKDFFLLNNGFFTRNYSAKMAGFLLLLKAICLNNTNTIQWSKSQIAQALGLSRNTVSTLLEECRQAGLIKPQAKGYELTTDCFILPTIKQTEAAIYKELCDFCKAKGVAAPRRNKVALSVLLTKYNAAGVPSTEPISLTYQLNKRCTQLPEKVSIPYFIKVLDMQEQYREVVEKNKQSQEELGGFEF